MAYKEVSRVEITEIIRQWQAGRGIREITRSTGLARNTIRKYLLTAQSCVYVVSESGTIEPLKKVDTLKAMPLVPDGSIILPSCC